MDDLATETRRLLDTVDARSASAITEATHLILGAIRADGLVHVAGAGHSMALVCETFFRAGGLACVRPIWHERLLPLRNARESTAAEREEGFARTVLEQNAPAPPDVAVVFSTSGTNPYPVEVAAECRAGGVPVIAFTSPAAAKASVPRAASNLADHASVVVDTCVPPGDSVYPATSPRTAAVSTMLAAYAWSQLLAELDDLAEHAGLSLPRWASANVPNGDACNEATFELLAPRVPELGGTTTSNSTGSLAAKPGR